jgi:hypothetical protein
VEQTRRDGTCLAGILLRADVIPNLG